MTDQEVRIAVVEACPSVFVRPVGHHGWNYKNSTVGRVLPCIDGDPLKDLNAMHEAEKALAPSQRRSYAINLLEVCNPNHEHSIDTLIYCYQNYIFATARQRAEAFLRTLNKRKD